MACACAYACIIHVNQPLLSDAVVQGYYYILLYGTYDMQSAFSFFSLQLKERDDDISSLQTEIQICDDRAVEKEQTPAMERTLQAKDQV